MPDPWAATEAPSSSADSEQTTLIDGSTFCISDLSGDIRSGGSSGLFVRDTRVLSVCLLTVNGRPLEPLTRTHPDPFGATFIARVSDDTGADTVLLVERSRYVGDGMREDLVVRNTSALPVTCQVVLSLDADLADLFEVKGGHRSQPQGETAVRESEGGLLFERPSTTDTSMRICSTRAPVCEGRRFVWDVAIDPHGRWETTLEVAVIVSGQPLAVRHPPGEPVEHSASAARLREWREDSPLLRSQDLDLTRTLKRSVEDLGSLRIFDVDNPSRAVVAAGAPWFMALFGRDSLLTSMMLLPVDTTLALGTLETLAEHQGRKVVPETEEEPGRILHEIRFGHAARLALGGGRAYYGTADATPLFVMLLGELHRWGVGLDRLRPLVEAADRAIAWIEQYGDVDGDGFVEYARKTPSGLLHQGWKDSWNGVTFADGRHATPPIALAEVQAYTYAAYRARAELAEALGEPSVKQRCEDRARRLKERFTEYFWLDDLGWYALALDADKRPVDSLASNMGHCLWAGIVETELAPQVARHLVSPDLFSGWGIRTLAASMNAYNPMSYHNGSVWPHDNALCAAGLMRYGFVAEALRVAEAQLSAARHFDHRLPELFCGFSTDEYAMPVPFPTSCSPQAWAAAAPVQLLRSLLRLEPHASRGEVWCDPVLPSHLVPLHFGPIRVGDDTISLDIDGSGWSAHSSRQQGLRAVQGVPPPG